VLVLYSYAGMIDAELQNWVDTGLAPFPKATHETAGDQSALGIGTGAFVRCTRSPFSWGRSGALFQPFGRCNALMPGTMR
jgi:hypothetical protein